MQLNAHPVRRCLAAACGALAVVALSAAQDVGIPPEVQESVVRFVVTCNPRLGESTTHEGLGVVVAISRDASQAWILTARHVVLPEHACEDRGGTLRLETESGQNVTDGKEMPTFVLSKPLDLALVNLTNPDAVVGLSAVALDLNPNLDERLPVYSVGTDAAKKLIRLDGVVDIRRAPAPRPEVIAHATPNYREGFSGGPLFSQDDYLLAINTTLRGAKSQVDVGWGPKISTALQITNRIPSALLRTDGKSREVAFRSYRLALGQLNRGKYAQATQSLVAARAQYSRSGERVHLRGVRFTGYYPDLFLAMSEVSHATAKRRAHRTPNCLKLDALDHLHQVQPSLSGSRRHARRLRRYIGRAALQPTRQGGLQLSSDQLAILQQACEENPLSCPNERWRSHTAHGLVSADGQQPVINEPTQTGRVLLLAPSRSITRPTLVARFGEWCAEFEGDSEEALLAELESTLGVPEAWQDTGSAP